MISIYRAKPDFENFAVIMPSEHSFGGEGIRKTLLKFDGQRKLNAWGSPRYCYVSDPRIPRGDFASFSIQSLAVRTEAFVRGGLSRFLFDEVAELLPLVDENDGTEWYVINLLHLVNCVDRERSEIGVTPPFQRRFEFLPQRMKHNVFTAWWPRSFWRELLCWEEYADPHSEFKARVETAGLSGLEFQLLWDEGGGGRNLRADRE